MTSTTGNGSAVGYAVFEELRTDAPETAEGLVGLLAAEIREWVSGREGFRSARLHLGLDRTTVVSRVEWADEKAFLATADAAPADSPLRTLSERPGVLAHTSFRGTPQSGLDGPDAGRRAGIMCYAVRHVGGRDDALALAALLRDAGGWKHAHPGFVSATPYIGDDGSTYVNYPQWLDEDSFRAYMDHPQNAAGQEAVARLETAAPHLVLCTLAEQIDAGTDAPPTAARSTGSLTTGAVSPLSQLRLFEEKYDPSSVEVLDGLPFDPAWRCLELGAGAGSMSLWLARRAHRGSVLAVDTDTTHLDAGHTAGLTVRRADIEELDFAPGSFDLIFTRATLEHLRDPDAALARARTWLAPGGWLVVGDFYYMPADEAPTAVGRALLRGYVGHMKSIGADMSWARGLPAALARTGLTSIGTHLTPAGPGQSPVDDELIGLRMRQEGQNLVDKGVVTAAELAAFMDTLGTPAGRDLTALLVTAWGRRPAD
ncbi:class I SAM-dependent methyltransferase [Streptomyces sp. SYP-A7185]|uniref:class I SAM-dependent methyltransferase n=1 Tax=Streptomyces sp. SYP-A7185 TaxID=3040076 RepID=UPI0038F618E2